MALNKATKEVIDYAVDEQRKLVVEMIDQVMKYIEQKQPQTTITDEVLERRLTTLEQRMSATSDRIAIRQGFGLKK